MKIKCSVKTCQSLFYCKGFCRIHYVRWVKYGDPNFMKKGPNGAGNINQYGYRRLFIDGKEIPEHRYVVEQHIGRKLKPYPEEVIHHINGNKLDNRIENLRIISASEHSILHNLKSIQLNGKKLCTKCKLFKSINRFYKNSHIISKLSPRCKDCIDKQVKQYRDNLKART